MSAKGKFTNLYVSVPVDDDMFIDQLREKKIRNDKKHYTKSSIINHLISTGIDVEKGKYLKLDQNIDEFVSKLQIMTIEVEGEKVKIKKSKEQVYNMLIEKGLAHLND